MGGVELEASFFIAIFIPNLLECSLYCLCTGWNRVSPIICECTICGIQFRSRSELNTEQEEVLGLPRIFGVDTVAIEFRRIPFLCYGRGLK